MSVTTYYKVLGPNREANMGRGVWPQAKRWTPEEPNPVLCNRGWHLVPASHLVDFLGYGPVIWTAEPHPGAVVVEGAGKVECSKARLLERTLWDESRARLFAADCAERVLPVFERDRPGDDRPRKAIEVARLFALGLATREERAAVGAAVWAAERDAVGAAERAAEREWQTVRLLAYLHAPNLADLLEPQP